MAIKLENLADGIITINAKEYVTREDGTRLAAETLVLLRDIEGIREIVYLNANKEVQNRFYDFFRRDSQYIVQNPIEAKDELHMEVRD